MISRRKAVPRKRVRSRKPRSSGVKNLTSLIKKVVLRTSETKFCVRNLETAFIVHNVPALLDSNMTVVIPGTSDEQRIGDSIVLQRFHIRIMLSTLSGLTPNVMYKFWLVRTPINNTTSLPYTYATWFKSYLGHWPLDPLNTDLVTVVATKSGKIASSFDNSVESGSAGYSMTKFIDWTVNMKNRRIEFAQDATTYPKNFVYQLLCAAYDNYGTLNTQNIMRIQYSTQMYFKDP